MTDETPETDAPAAPTPKARRRVKIVRRPKSGLGWFVFVLACLVLLVAAAGLVTRYGVLTPPGRLLIEANTSGLRLGRVGKLKIEGLSGDIWGHFGVRRLTISDEQGVWLEASKVDVTWRATELFNRRLHATALAADQVRVIRRPTLTPKGPPSGELPVAFDIDSLKTRVLLEPAFSVQRGDFDLTGDFVVSRAGAAKGQVAAASRLHVGDGLKAAFDIGQGQRTQLHVEATEAQGGALAGAVGLDAGKPFALSAHADGTPNKGQFTLVARSGDRVPLDARGAWAPEGGEVRAKVELAASSLMEGNVHRFGPQIDLAVTGKRNPAGLQDVTLDAKSENLVLHASGPIDMTKRASSGIRLDIAVADTNRLTAFPHVGATRVTGVLSGTGSDWLVKGQGVVSGTSMAGYTLATAQGPVTVAHHKNSDLDVIVDLNGSGGSGQTIFANWMGAQPRLAVSLTRFADHRILIRSLSGQGAGITLTGRGSRNLFDAFAFDGDLKITNVDAVHHGAKGVLAGRWNAAKGKPGTPWKFDFDGRGSDFATGYAEFDRLLGPTPRLNGQAAMLDDRWSFSKLVVEGDKAFIGGAGTMDPQQVLNFTLDWRAKGPFHAGPVEIAGDVKGDGTLTGALSAPRADLTADIQSIDFPRLTIQPAALTLTFQRTETGGDGSIKLTGKTAYGEALARADFKFREDGLDLSGIDARAAGLSAQGALALRGSSPSTADLTLAIGPGAFLEGGKATATVQIVDQGASPQGTIKLQAADLRFKDSDTLIKSLTLTGQGPLSQMPYQATGDISLPQTPVKFSGSGVAAEKGDAWQVTFNGTGKAMRADLKTLSPLVVNFGGPETSATGALGIGTGRADFRASQTDETVAIDARVQNVDLAVASEDLTGKISGALALSGRGKRLSGTLDANLAGARSRDGPPELAITGQVKGQINGDRIVLTADATNEKGLRSTANVTLPAETSAAPLRIAIVRTKPMTGAFNVDGELQPIWDLFFGGERTLGGHLTAEGALAGTLNDPRITGHAQLASGRFEDTATGLRLTNVTVGADLTSDDITFRQFNGADGHGGTLTGSGRISLDKGGSSTFTLNASRFRLIDNDLGEAEASGAVTATRGADGKVKLVGKLTVDRADIVAKPPTPSGVTPMPVIRRNVPPGREEFFQAPKATARGPAVALDVTLTAPRRIFVRGNGLDVEMSLDAHVTGDTARPQLEGTARVVRGDYQFASKRFEFDDRGVIYLATTIDRIRLDLQATREDPSLTAVVKITGTAAKPIIVLTSVPVLPQDEVLSQVLFGHSASQLSPLEAAQVASALSGLASGGGLDVIGNLRAFAGLDRLAFAGDEATGVAVSGGKYITDDVYLEITGGGREGSAVQVEWRVRRTLSIVSRLAQSGESKLSVRWRRDVGRSTDRR